MKRSVMLLAVALVAQSFGQSLSIANHSFENPALSSGGFFYSPTPMPSWSSTGTGGADRGIWNTGATGKDGNNIAFAYANNAFAQQLTANLLPSTSYTLQFLLGRTQGLTTGTAEVWAGGTVTGGNVIGGTLMFSRSLSLSSSTMSERSLAFTTPAVAPFLGQPITVRLAGSTISQGYVSFDNIRLTAGAPTPPRVTGTIQLAGYAGAMNNDLLRFEVWQGTSRLEASTVVVGAGGTYAASPNASGALTFKFKFRSGLRKAVNINNLGANPLTGVNLTMLNGDADQSGEVDAADIDLIISFFGAGPGSPGFNSLADLDGSDEVDAADIDIAIANFGADDE